jgi:hypothetical protein
VLNEPSVRDPLLSVLKLASLVGVAAMPLFFLIAAAASTTKAGCYGP